MLSTFSPFWFCLSVSLFSAARVIALLLPMAILLLSLLLHRSFHIRPFYLYLYTLLLPLLPSLPPSIPPQTPSEKPHKINSDNPSPSKRAIDPPSATRARPVVLPRTPPPALPRRGNHFFWLLICVYMMDGWVYDGSVKTPSNFPPPSLPPSLHTYSQRSLPEGRDVEASKFGSKRQDATFKAAPRTTMNGCSSCQFRKTGPTPAIGLANPHAAISGLR